MLRAALLATFLFPLGCGITPVDSTSQREGNKVTHDLGGGGPTDLGCGGGPHDDGGWIDGGETFDIAGYPLDAGYPTDIGSWPVDFGPWPLDAGHSPNDLAPVDLAH
jgi:hypothetical protein